MNTKRPKATKILTPFGRAAWCSLSRPSDKFKADGEYSARILLDPGPETDALIKQLDDLYEAAYQDNLHDVQKDKPKVQEIKRADKPYKHQEDPDTGEQLPGYTINSRLSAIVRGKKKGDGSPGEKLYDRRPAVVDSKNQPIRQEIGAGSIIRLSVDASPFFTAALGSGLSLRLIGVQVKELVPIGMREAGFDDVEGFEAPQNTASDPAETTHAPTENAAPADASTGDVAAEW
jgi:hypothetical protein